MSLARAFTTRRAKKLDVSAPAPPPQRSATPKLAHGTIKRNQISSPVELLSTTNMLSYNAPDIYPKNGARKLSSISIHSGEESDNSRMTTPLTTPDNSSIESSSPSTPEPNHLSSFFGRPSMQSISSNDDAPSIPKRAPSHTKKSHEILSRKRSETRMSSPKSPRATARSSINMFSGNIVATIDAEPHPFGNELAQVTEIAEEYGITQETLAVVDEEEQELLSRGLFKFRAEDYMSEIQGLFIDVKVKGSMAPVWI
ncbi:hypothetical protein ACMFMF_000594 [Clarireedia jacksonii]